MKFKNNISFLLYIIIFVLIYIGMPSIFRPLMIPDEGRYAEVARSTLENGYWLKPHLNEVPHLTKPPLFYNLTALSFAIFGLNPFAARFIPLISFIILTLFCMKWIYKFGGINASLLFLIINLTILQNVAMAQFCDLNMTFSVILTIGMLKVFEYLENPQKNFSLYLGCILIGIAFLTKGPPALLIFFGTLFFYKFIDKKSPKINFGDWLVGILLILVIGLPWYIWIYSEEGDKVISFWFENIVRRTSLNKGNQAFYLLFFYIPVFFIGSSLWGVYFVYIIIEKMRKEVDKIRLKSIINFLKNKVNSASHLEIYLLSWITFTLIIFSLMHSTMISYILPAYTPFTLYLSLFFSRKLNKINPKNNNVSEKEYFKTQNKISFNQFLNNLKSQAASVYKTAKISLVLTFILTFGATTILYISVKTHTNLKLLSSQKYDALLISEVLRDWRGKKFDLVQAYYFSPDANFVLRKNSILVKEVVNNIWSMPKNFAMKKSELRTKIDNNEPLFIIVPTNKLHLLELGNRKLNILYNGKKYMLLSNIK